MIDLIDSYLTVTSSWTECCSKWKHSANPEVKTQKEWQKNNGTNLFKRKIIWRWLDFFVTA